MVPVMAVRKVAANAERTLSALVSCATLSAPTCARARTAKVKINGNSMQAADLLDMKKLIR